MNFQLTKFKRGPMPVMPEMCATCPFRDQPGSGLRSSIEARILNEASQTCHSTGVLQGKPDTHLCRGGRNWQLQIFAAIGFLSAPTDEAWDARCRELGHVVYEKKKAGR